MTAFSISLQVVVLAIVIALCIFFTARVLRKKIRDHWHMANAKMAMMQTGLDMYLKDEQQKTDFERMKDRVAIQQAARKSKNRIEYMCSIFDEIQTLQEGSDSALKLLNSASVKPGQKEWYTLIGVLQSNLDMLGELAGGAKDTLRYGDLSEIDKSDKVDVNALCSDVFDECMAHVKEGVDTSFETSLPDGYTVLTNAMCLKMILKNLILSAMEFTHKGSIKLTVVEEAKKGRLRFELIDTGRGIPEQVKSDLFYKLPDDKPLHKIIGIRLRNCRIFTRLLEGNIYVDPMYADGTMIAFTIKNKQ